jgi:hypothetical protein
MEFRCSFLACNSLLLVFFLSKINPVYTVPSSLFKAHFNITFPPTPSSSISTLFLNFPSPFLCIYLFSHAFYLPPKSHSHYDLPMELHSKATYRNPYCLYHTFRLFSYLGILRERLGEITTKTNKQVKTRTVCLSNEGLERCG